MDSIKFLNYIREIKMSGLEKLSIRISYDEETSLSLKEFNNYLSGLNIKSVSSGSVILESTQQVLIAVLPVLYLWAFIILKNI